MQSIYIGLFANELLPLRPGELIRCYLLAHWSDLRLSLTFASIGGRPFVPEVPIGHITRIEPTPGQLFSSGVVAPYVDFNSVDVVGIVVGEPRTIKRDSLLPPSPTPSPSRRPSTLRRAARACALPGSSGWTGACPRVNSSGV